MMKQFIGLTWEEAISLATALGYMVTTHDADAYEDAWIELESLSFSSCAGMGLFFGADDTVEYYEPLGWI